MGQAQGKTKQSGQEPSHTLRRCIQVNKKFFALLASLMLIGSAFLVGCSQEGGDEGTTDTPATGSGGDAPKTGTMDEKPAVDTQAPAAGDKPAGDAPATGDAPKTEGAAPGGAAPGGAAPGGAAPSGAAPGGTSSGG